jgi:hypothetical protein
MRSLLILALSLFSSLSLMAQMQIDESELLGTWKWETIERMGKEGQASNIFEGDVFTILKEDGTYEEIMPKTNGNGSASNYGQWRLDHNEESEYYLSLSPDGENWRPAAIRTYETGRMRLEFVRESGKSYLVMIKVEE